MYFENPIVTQNEFIAPFDAVLCKTGMARLNPANNAQNSGLPDPVHQPAMDVVFQVPVP